MLQNAVVNLDIAPPVDKGDLYRDISGFSKRDLLEIIVKRQEIPSM